MSNRSAKNRQQKDWSNHEKQPTSRSSIDTLSKVRIAVHQSQSDKPVDLLEFSPEMEVEANAEDPETQREMQQKSQYVMEPIEMNTQPSLLRKKNNLDAIIQGITIPLQSLTLLPHVK